MSKPPAVAQPSGRSRIHPLRRPGPMALTVAQVKTRNGGLGLPNHYSEPYIGPPFTTAAVAGSGPVGTDFPGWFADFAEDFVVRSRPAVAGVHRAAYRAHPGCLGSTGRQECPLASRHTFVHCTVREATYWRWRAWSGYRRTSIRRKSSSC